MRVLYCAPSRACALLVLCLARSINARSRAFPVHPAVPSPPRQGCGRVEEHIQALQRRGSPQHASVSPPLHSSLPPTDCCCHVSPAQSHDANGVLHRLRDAVHALALDIDVAGVREIFRSHSLSEKSTVDFAKFTWVVQDLVNFYRQHEDEGEAAPPKQQARRNSRAGIDNVIVNHHAGSSCKRSEQMIDASTSLNHVRCAGEELEERTRRCDNVDDHAVAPKDRFDAQMAAIEDDQTNGELPSYSMLRFRSVAMEMIPPSAVPDQSPLPLSQDKARRKSLDVSPALAAVRNLDEFLRTGCTGMTPREERRMAGMRF